ncbi:hypothetical protein A2U01_0052833, partial [Trifolium medium]|nr:hypothetical protein [Trifolium medium]
FPEREFSGIAAFVGSIRKKTSPSALGTPGQVSISKVKVLIKLNASPVPLSQMDIGFVYKTRPTFAPTPSVTLVSDKTPAGVILALPWRVILGSPGLNFA